LDDWVNFAFTARLNSLTTQRTAGSSIVQGGGKRESAQSKAFGELLGEQGRSEAIIERSRKALLPAPDHTGAMFNLALLLLQKN
jgi:hypothetical protein